MEIILQSALANCPPSVSQSGGQFERGAIEKGKYLRIRVEFKNIYVICAQIVYKRVPICSKCCIFLVKWPLKQPSQIAQWLFTVCNLQIGRDCPYNMQPKSGKPNLGQSARGGNSGGCN